MENSDVLTTELIVSLVYHYRYTLTGGSMKEAFIIGLSGGSASGKTTVAARIIEELDLHWVVILSMDSFYKVCSALLGSEGLNYGSIRREY